MSYFVHPSSFVDQGAEIGSDSKVWHFSHVSTGAKIGKKVTIGQNVFVGGRAIVGDFCKIQNNVSLYDAVVLEDGVFCGPSSVFTNVNNPRALVERKAEFRPTLVKKGASLGANSTIVCGATIGRYAFIGAGAVVADDVPDFALMVGVPAKQIGWVSAHGERLELPLRGEGVAECPATGEKYKLVGQSVEVLHG